MLSQVNLLLDRSMLAKDHFRTSLDYVPLNQTLKHIIDIFKPQADLKEIKIILLNSSKEVLVKLDKLRISQVIINLLSNALKYSPSKEDIFVKC